MNIDPSRTLTILILSARGRGNARVGGAFGGGARAGSFAARPVGCVSRYSFFFSMVSLSCVMTSCPARKSMCSGCFTLIISSLPASAV